MLGTALFLLPFSLPSPIVQVNYKGVVAKLLKRFIVVTIHVTCFDKDWMY